jgi:peptide/nickel transport system ATP-binding protein
MVSDPLLRVEGLHVAFSSKSRAVEVLRDVNFDVAAGETVCIVGESGSGKSMTALAMLGLIPQPGRITKGRILLEGQDLASLSRKAMQATRGARISMIFQEPMNSLNPVLTVTSQIGEVLRRHSGLSRRQASDRVVDLLRAVGIPAPEERARAYPHQMSGGMRQRVMIAMAIACRPQLLIADEPTTALDVTVQKQILRLLKSIQRESKMALLLITHDMGIVSEMGDRVVVMYAGQVVEIGAVAEVLSRPRHPYTQALITCAPRMSREVDERERLPEIPGTVPALDRLPIGCTFAPRCAQSIETCQVQRPPHTVIGGTRVACWVAAAGTGGS